MLQRGVCALHASTIRSFHPSFCMLSRVPCAVSTSSFNFHVHLHLHLHLHYHLFVFSSFNFSSYFVFPSDFHLLASSTILYFAILHVILHLCPRSPAPSAPIQLFTRLHTRALNAVAIRCLGYTRAKKRVVIFKVKANAQ